MRIRTNLGTTRSARTLNKCKVIWGFMLENTLFTEFQEENHVKIEAAYSQRKQRSTSYYIELEDRNLPKPHKARVYFGVARMHLRMPGTRYYVERHVSTSPPLLSPCSVTSLTGSDGSYSSPLPMTPAFMPSPMSTTSTATSITTNSSGSFSLFSDLLYPPLDPTLAALFSEDLMLPISNGAISDQNASINAQFFTPTCHQNVRNDDFAKASGSSLTPGAFNGNGPQVYNNFSSASMNSCNKSFRMTASLDQKIQYVDSAQHKQQQQQHHLQQQRQQQSSVSFVHDYSGPLPTDENDLLRVVNWLNDDTLCTPTPGANNSNNDGISFQELVSWPPLGPSLAPKFNNSIDNGNVNMTNLYHDLNHFRF